MACLVGRSVRIGNHQDQFVLQEFFHTVSAFCLFGIQPFLNHPWQNWSSALADTDHGSLITVVMMLLVFL